MEIVIDDIMMNVSNFSNWYETKIDFNSVSSTSYDEREELFEYTEEKAKELIEYLKGFGFTFQKEEVAYGGLNDKNVFIDVFSCGRTLEVKIFIEKKYNAAKTYIEKLKCFYYLQKCYDFFISIKEKENLRFSQNGKIRNFYEIEKNKLK